MHAAVLCCAVSVPLCLCLCVCVCICICVCLCSRCLQSTLTAAFGPGWERFLELDEDPVGSGCVAQVYRAQLTHNGKQQTVAVKVIHPYVQVESALFALPCSRR